MKSATTHLKTGDNASAITGYKIGLVGSFNGNNPGVKITRLDGQSASQDSGCTFDNCSPGANMLVRIFSARRQNRKSRCRQRNILIWKMESVKLKDPVPRVQILSRCIGVSK